jgi:Flp pilus assembly protein TadG
MQTAVLWANRHRPSAERRRGAAAVEAALCVPLVVLITLTAVDMYRLIMFRQKLTICVATLSEFLASPEVDSSELLALGGSLATSRGLTGATVTVPEQADLLGGAPGAVFEVQVAAPTPSPFNPVYRLAGWPASLAVRGWAARENPHWFDN